MSKSDLILLAVDNEQVLHLFERALKAPSYQTLISNGYGNLLNEIQANNPVALIVSENFSGYSGVSISAMIKETFPGLPVLLYALKESTQLLRSALRFGISDCLIPPFNPGEIVESVDSAIKRSVVLNDRMNSDFVNTVSHDLRSPLTAIIGYVDLLGRVGPLNDKQKEFVHQVQLSVGTVTELINDLLELGRIEAGVGGSFEFIHFEDILNKALDGFKLRIEQKEIDLTSSISKKIPGIYGNPVRIRQLVDNLLENALKYSPDKGKINVSLQAEAGHLIFQVSDEGPGIPAEDRPFIFNKFFRGSNISSKVDGSGLGLSIVKSIVDLHKAKVWVDSPEEGGSKFTVSFPISDE